MSIGNHLRHITLLPHRSMPFYFDKILLLLIAIGLGACATTSVDETGQKYWPPAPEIPRVVFETTLKNPSSLQAKNAVDEFQSFATGELADQAQSFAKPYDVAAYGGLVVVSDSLLGVVHAFDINRKRVFAIGWRGAGRLLKPLGVAIDNKQNIYIVDAGLGFVVKYDKLGHFLATIGKREDFARISDVAVSNKTGDVFVVDRGGVESLDHRVVVFSADGEKQQIIGRRGVADGEFNHPTQIAIDEDGWLYVLDAGNFRVQLFNEQNKFVRHWGRIGKNLGNLARPRGIAVNRDKYVFVTDGAFQNYQIFNRQGQLLLDIGAGGGRDLPGHYMLPSGIAVDETNRIYVVDQVRRKVEVFRLLSSEEIAELSNKKTE